MGNITRRKILKSAGTVALLGGAQLTHGAVPTQALIGPDNTLKAYQKMRFALDDKLVFWWMRATKYGLVDSEVKPLYGMEIGNIAQVTQVDSVSFTAKTLEIVYATNEETGELLEEWLNPYTGAVRPMQHIPIGPNTLHHTIDGPELPTELPGAKLEATAEFGPMWFEGDSVWVRDDTAALVTQLDGKSTPFRVYDWPTYQSLVAEVQDPELQSARCNITFTAVSDWQRWMGMQGQPGNLLSRASGQKTRDFAELPARFRRLLEENHPFIAENPEKALALPPFRFER